MQEILVLDPEMHCFLNVEEVGKAKYYTCCKCGAKRMVGVKAWDTGWRIKKPPPWVGDAKNNWIEQKECSNVLLDQEDHRHEFLPTSGG
jgi:hypothetical protein